MQRSFADVQGFFADIQGSFADIHRSFVEIQGSFTYMQGSFEDVKLGVDSHTDNFHPVNQDPFFLKSQNLNSIQSSPFLSPSVS